MYTTDSKAKSVSLAELFFYFDAIEKSTLDAEGLSRKAAQIAAVRSSLIHMPHEDFELAMASIEKLIPTKAAAAPGKGGKAAARAEGGRLLFDRSTDENP